MAPNEQLEWTAPGSWRWRLAGRPAGRFQVSYAAMAGALGNGYVATTTDAGLGMSLTPDPWDLNSPGNADLYALQNLASVSLKDQVRTKDLEL